MSGTLYLPYRVEGSTLWTDSGIYVACGTPGRTWRRLALDSGLRSVQGSAGEGDALGAQVLDGLGGRLRGDARGEAEQDLGDEPGAGRVGGGRVHAVVGGDAGHVDLVDTVSAEPVGQRRPGLVGTLEAAVRGRVRAFQEHRLHRRSIQGRVKIRARGPGHAVRRPGRGVVRVIGEVGARVDVEVLGRHHVPVTGAARHVRADRAGHRGAAGYGERPALAEVVLDVDDDQCTHGANGIFRTREAS